MVYNPGRTQSAADAISSCQPLHMLYISIGQTGPADSDEEFMEFLELDLEDVHVAVNLINSDKEVNMMSLDVIHRAIQEDGTMLTLMDHIRRGMPDSGLELDISH